jgi:diketogulonate reductase-like aldo/keto reductase
MPSIAFGTWMLGNGQGPIDQVEQAISVGFSHIGTIDIASLLRDAWHN